jgi:DNA-binding response OmpR family regulator
VTTGDAVVRLLDGSCDLLLLSTDLPILSAFEVCRIVRARPETAGLPIVVVEFGGMNDISAVQAFQCGADDYVDSAAGLPALLSRIRSVLLRRYAVQFVPAALGEYAGQHLVVRFDDVFVSVDGKPIMLQRLEFCVLRYLVQRRNQLVSREALHRDVWRGRGTLTGRTIDAHVCRLRRKLGVAGKHIQTLVSLGYRFVDELDQP